ncbi:hypothetical protein AA309_07400 [Microvirga vignae]|uniref:Uncharacterized protein n=1 Tax=Microvirga vignae TaxID=1225564 RepID=A0A0H1RLY9_9HYPH|nr:hypothetical protein [Microvirga vignae]KLK93672.1 hypothetical protein AA309_07400 [Microvirga vignae]
MCMTALPLMSLAIGAASSVAEFAQQSTEADDANRRYEANRLAALQSFEDKQRSMNEQIIQERESAAQERFDVALESRAAQATNDVAAGESGVSGLSIDALARDFAAKEARFSSRMDTQQDWTMTRLEAEKRDQSYEALDRINQAPRAKKSSFLGTGLKIGASAVNAYSQHKKLNAG